MNLEVGSMDIAPKQQQKCFYGGVRFVMFCHNVFVMAVALGVGTPVTGSMLFDTCGRNLDWHYSAAPLSSMHTAQTTNISSYAWHLVTTSVKNQIEWLIYFILFCLLTVINRNILCIMQHFWRQWRRAGSGTSIGHGAAVWRTRETVVVPCMQW